MANPLSNKKKVRGWRRQIEALDVLKRRNLTINEAWLRSHRMVYAKLQIHPWNKLVKRNPPIWYRRLFIRTLLEIHDSWAQQLEAIGEPYYLTLWLYHPRFFKTELLAQLSDDPDYYDKLHNRRIETPPPLDLYAHPDYDLTAFDWQGYIDDDIVCEIDGSAYMTPEHIAQYRKNAYDEGTSTVTKSVYRLFFFKKGKVWVGTQRAT